MTTATGRRVILSAAIVVILAIGIGAIATSSGLESATDADTFTATGQQNGTIVLDNETDDPIRIPECDGDEPLPENAAEGVIWEETCFEFEASIDGTDWEADAENVTFPLITDTDPDSLATEASVQISAPEGLSGTLDPETGTVTVEGPLAITADIEAPLRQGDICETVTDLEATTNESGALEGEPLESANGANVTVVDNEFVVPEFPEGSLACNGANSAYGLPSEEGESYFELEFAIEFEE